VHLVEVVLRNNNILQTLAARQDAATGKMLQQQKDNKCEMCKEAKQHNTLQVRQILSDSLFPKRGWSFK
jgi:hypothetical protein